MKLPAGRLVRSRVVTDPRTVLVDALDRELTGYAVLEPQDALLLDAEGRGVLTFREGVPVVAYHTRSGRGGPPALADLAAEGPYQLELFAVDPPDLSGVHDNPSFRVPPGTPAERLAGDQALADRTRDAAPADRTREAAPTGERDDPPVATRPGETGAERGASAVVDSGGGAERADRNRDRSGAVDERDRPVGAVEAFLDDREKIAAIREEARAEAEARADEWGFDEVGDEP